MMNDTVSIVTLHRATEQRVVYTQREDAKAVKSRCILFRVQKGLEVMPLIVIALELSNIIVTYG